MTAIQDTPATAIRPPTESLSIGLWLEPSQIPDDMSFIMHLAMGLKSEGHGVHIFSSHAQDADDAGIFSVPVIRVHQARRWWQALLPLLEGRPGRGEASTGCDSMAAVLNECRLREIQVMLLFGRAATALPDFSLLPHSLPTLFWCWDQADIRLSQSRDTEFSGVLAASIKLSKEVKRRRSAAADVLRPGVFFPGPEPRDSRRANASPCFVCLDSLRGLEAFSNLLGACRDVADSGRSFLLFLYDSGPDKHAIWKLTQQLNLLDRVSFVPYRHDCERLLLYGDFYLQVAESNRVNYVVLQAMARGLPVLGRPNPAADLGADDQTFRSVESGSRQDWRDAITAAVDGDACFGRMSMAAMEELRLNYSMSDMLTQVAIQCKKAIATPIPFPGRA